MASKVTVEMSAYGPAAGITVVQQQPPKHSNNKYDWWQLLKNGAKSRLGPDIEVLRTEACEGELNRFVEDIEFTVAHSDSEPLVTRPTIIDVTTKEIVNLGDKEKDETVIRVGKNQPICAGTRYHFSSNEGVSFDHKYNFGARIVGLAIAGGYMRIGVDNERRDQGYNVGLQFDYQQEEKLSIPPKTKVRVKITTLTKKFRQDYMLQFRTPRSRYVRVNYLTRCQQNCCDNCFFFSCCGCCCMQLLLL